jgi:hypothetical protein
MLVNLQVLRLLGEEWHDKPVCQTAVTVSGISY